MEIRESMQSFAQYHIMHSNLTHSKIWSLYNIFKVVLTTLSMLLFAHFSLSTLASLLFFQCARHSPTASPLHMLFLLPKLPFLNVSLSHCFSSPLNANKAFFGFRIYNTNTHHHLVFSLAFITICHVFIFIIRFMKIKTLSHCSPLYP